MISSQICHLSDLPLLLLLLLLPLILSLSLGASKNGRRLRSHSQGKRSLFICLLFYCNLQLPFLLILQQLTCCSFSSLTPSAVVFSVRFLHGVSSSPFLDYFTFLASTHLHLLCISRISPARVLILRTGSIHLLMRTT